MKMNEISFPNRKPIDGYGPGFFRVGGSVIEGGVLVLPQRSMSWQGFEDVSALVELAEDIDILLIGTGAEIAVVPEALTALLDEAQIGFEFMATPAACRSFNVLLAEGRMVGAALLPV